MRINEGSYIQLTDGTKGFVVDVDFGQDLVVMEREDDQETIEASVNDVKFNLGSPHPVIIQGSRRH